MKRKQNQKHCERCSKPFGENLTPRKFKKQRFCSPRCSGAFRSKPLTRSDYRGASWQTQREKALVRDGYACQLCKIAVNITPQDHAVHHIVSFHDIEEGHIKANRLDNLVTLCSDCHHKVEGNPDLLADYMMKKVKEDMLYEITHEWFGDGGEATIAEAQAMVDEWQTEDFYYGWTLKVEASGSELRIYAHNNSEDAEPLSTTWFKITDDMYYVIIGKEVQIEAE